MEDGSHVLQEDKITQLPSPKTLGPRSKNVAGPRSLVQDFRDVGADVAPLTVPAAKYGSAIATAKARGSGGGDVLTSVLHFAKDSASILSQVEMAVAAMMLSGKRLPVLAGTMETRTKSFWLRARWNPTPQALTICLRTRLWLLQGPSAAAMSSILRGKVCRRYLP